MIRVSDTDRRKAFKQLGLSIFYRPGAVLRGKMVQFRRVRTLPTNDLGKHSTEVKRYSLSSSLAFAKHFII